MTEASVLEAFQKFDLDGSGAISREELAEVLQGLNPEQWDGHAVDQLLATADSSGDGELQISEFVNWVFAEDKDIAGVAKGMIRGYVLKGCSRKQFNGLYMQKPGQFYYRRPVFHCKENDMVLFYHGTRKQWQVYWRTANKCSLRLKTRRPPHMKQPGEAWAVWKSKKGREKKSFVKEPRLTCEAASVTLTAPETLKVHSMTLAKTDQVRCGCPVYENKSWKRLVWYNEATQCWNDLPFDSDSDDFPCSIRSYPCAPCDPRDVKFMVTYGKGTTPYDTFPKVPESPKLQRFLFDGTYFKEVPAGWIDADFPHNNDSLGKMKATDSELHWIRATSQSCKTKLRLFSDLEPAHFLQGSIGDCWLICALACVAEFPHYFQEKIFVTQEIPEDGRYKVNMFIDDEWKVIEVDDYLVCRKASYINENGRHVKAKDHCYCSHFAKLPDGLMTLAIIEKVFAKTFGNYGAIEGDWMVKAWSHLLGEKNYQSMETRRHYSYYDNVPYEWEILEKVDFREAPDSSAHRIGRLMKGCVVEEVKPLPNGYIKFKKLCGESEGPEEGYFRYYAAGKRVATRKGFWDKDVTQKRVLKVDQVDVYENFEAQEPSGQLLKWAHFEVLETKKTRSYVEMYKFKKIRGDGPEEGWIPGIYSNSVNVNYTMRHQFQHLESKMTGKGGQFTHQLDSTDDISQEDAWQVLLKWDQANSLMACSMMDERLSNWGLVKQHAYSVLHAVEVEGFKLVCLRNPHGSCSEWNCPWGDMSEEWRKNPKIAEMLKVDRQGDGMFWMDYEDFATLWTMECMAVPGASKRAAFEVEIEEEDEEPEEEEEIQEEEEEPVPVEPELETGGLLGCEGLEVTWNHPQQVREGVLTNPGDRDYWLKNVPEMLLGASYVGTKTWPKAGTWTIKYQAPTKLYVWADRDNFNAGVDDALQADAWEREDPGDFQRSDGNALSLWSRTFMDGSSYEIQTTDLVVAGVIGNHVRCCGKVVSCSGLNIDWNEAQTLCDATLVNPGQRDYTFTKVPERLLGGQYIGTKTWPSAGTWTIEVEAPVKLYVFVMDGHYNAGVDDFLHTNGWHPEDAGGFQRSDGLVPFRLWSRVITQGNSVEIITQDLMVGGVIWVQD